MSALGTTTFSLSVAVVIVAARTANADPMAATPAEPPEIHARIGDPVVSDPVATPMHDDDGPAEPRPSEAGDAASAGAFLPFTVGASTDTTYGRALSGYDGGRRAFVYEGAADAHVMGGLSVRAGYSSHDLSGTASGLLGARFRLLSQKLQGVDLGFGLFYLPQGIDGEGLVRGSVFVGREIGKAALFGSASYGQDPEGDDHHAELSMGSVFRLTQAVFVGADARVRGLVFSSDQKHAGITEPVFDAALGPLAHYVLGPVVLTGEAGVSALALRGPHGSIRPTTEVQYGVLGLFSAGFAL
jgi:hypothetical protein